MSTRTISVIEAEGGCDGIGEAVTVLDGGGLVVFPTETVYGIAARADLSDALQHLYEAKERTVDKPFTIHIGRRSDAERYAPDLSAVAKRFMRKAWPGPLTLIVTTANPTDAPVAGDLDPTAIEAIYHAGTVALRYPDDSVAIELLKRTRGPVVAASANRAGRTPPRTVQEALAGLNGGVDLALDGGPARYNKPSTIVRIEGDRYELVREGVYDQRMLRSFARVNILFVCTGNTCRSPMAHGFAERFISERIGCAPEELSDRNIGVVSAGTLAGHGVRASQHAVEVLAGRGIDIASHQSQPLTIELVNEADCIYTMTASHRSVVLNMVRSAEDRTKGLLGQEDIADPMGGDREVYAGCAKTIEKAVKDRLREVEL